jgi:hypothetical protein
VTAGARRIAAAMLGAAGAVLALSGCASGPDPAAQVRADEVYDRLLQTLEDTDAGVLRTVEEVGADRVACVQDGWTQLPSVARGTLSVRAENGAAADILDALAAELGAEWTPAPTSSPGAEPADTTRAWSSPDGVTVTLVDASPVIVVAVFPPCAPPDDSPAA